jgi:hypothetical protein
MTGIGGDVFYPNGETTRAAFVTTLWRLSGSPAPQGTGEAAPFTDAEPGAWYEQAVAWAQENGLVMGYYDGRFGVADSITREQMASLFSRFSDFIAMESSGAAHVALGGFKDAGGVSSWATASITWALDEGLLTGRPGGLIDPAATATRAEFATILSRYLDKF